MKPHSNKYHPQTNTHHIINKCRGGTDVSDNIIRLPINTHNAIHTLFGNLHPHEQLIHILSLNITAIQRQVKKDVLEVIMDNQDYFYKDGLWIKQ